MLRKCWIACILSTVCGLFAPIDCHGGQLFSGTPRRSLGPVGRGERLRWVVDGPLVTPFPVSRCFVGLFASSPRRGFFLDTLDGVTGVDLNERFWKTSKCSDSLI